jgi:hypothetical protein
MNILNELILKEVDKLNKLKKHEYKVIYSDKYYLKMIMYLLNDINNWSFLKNIKGYGNNNKYIPVNHYKTIYNKYLYWNKKKVFYNAFHNYLCNYNTKLLIIDATSINTDLKIFQLIQNILKRK